MSNLSTDAILHPIFGLLLHLHSGGCGRCFDDIGHVGGNDADDIEDNDDDDLEVREGCKKSKWKFKMAFAMKGGGGLEGVSSAIYLF